ncbi:LIM/homeobox protein Lhx9-like [Lycorma delicatula]|uniref:LIM/homeobox protein Lhx9-like n=1 Tax=Lycorma delicatula TaxID=130591 RepID=UPI003F51508F
MAISSAKLQCYKFKEVYVGISALLLISLTDVSYYQSGKVAATTVEKAFYVLELAKTNSVTVVHRRFRTKYGNHHHQEVQSRTGINSFKTQYLCKKKSAGRLPVSEQIVRVGNEKSTRSASLELQIPQPTVMLKEHQDDSRSPGPTPGAGIGIGGVHVVCAACHQKITDRFYLLAVDRQWHLGCLQCCECKLPLDTELTCFARHGNIYCKEDYYRLFAVKRCGRCGTGISASELVMRARDAVYHLHCFSCASCGVLLTKGDHFGMRDGLVYCRPHYEVLRHRDYCGPVELEALSPAHWTAAAVQKGRPRKRKLLTSPTESLTSDLPVNMRIPAGTLEILHSGELSSSMESLSYDSAVTSPGVQSNQQRTKRMRTSFKHHQLRTMKSYFNINQNPDAKDLKQLAQKTGLSKRVLQVWFQNARAKWRRNLMRQEGGQNSGVPSQGASANSGGPPSVGAASVILGDSSSMDDIHMHHHHVQTSTSLGFSDLY